MEASKLYSKGVKFSSAFQVLKIYWRVETSLIFITCLTIKHDWLDRYEDKTV